MYIRLHSAIRNKGRKKVWYAKLYRSYSQEGKRKEVYLSSLGRVNLYKVGQITSDSLIKLIINTLLFLVRSDIPHEEKQKFLKYKIFNLERLKSKRYSKKIEFINTLIRDINDKLKRKYLINSKVILYSESEKSLLNIVDSMVDILELLDKNKINVKEISDGNRRFFNRYYDEEKKQLAKLSKLLRTKY